MSLSMKAWQERKHFRNNSRKDLIQLLVEFSKFCFVADLLREAPIFTNYVVTEEKDIEFPRQEMKVCNKSVGFPAVHIRRPQNNGMTTAHAHKSSLVHLPELAKNGVRLSSFESGCPARIMPSILKVEQSHRLYKKVRKNGSINVPSGYARW